MYRVQHSAILFYVCAEHVKLFLSGQEGGSSRLQQHLTEGNVFAWLRITSRFGLADSAEECITYIVSKSLPLPQGYISSVQSDALQQLFNAQQVQAVADKATLSRLTVDLTAITQKCSRWESEVKDLRESLDNWSDAAPLQRGSYCDKCGYKLFTKPKGKGARHCRVYCLNCGAPNDW